MNKKEIADRVDQSQQALDERLKEFKKRSRGGRSELKIDDLAGVMLRGEGAGTAWVEPWLDDLEADEADANKEGFTSAAHRKNFSLARTGAP